MKTSRGSSDTGPDSTSVWPLTLPRPGSGRSRSGIAWINVSPHLNLPLLLQVRPQVIEHGIVGRKLTVDVQQLAAGVAQEQPAGHAVVGRGEVQEENQSGPADEGRVLVKENGLVRCKEAQLAGKPSDKAGTR